MFQYFLLALAFHGVVSELDVYRSWNNADFKFPDGVSREDLINDGSFVPNNVVIMDVDVSNYMSPNEKIFVSTPKFRPGTPATLSTVDEDGLLNPYPSWDWQTDSDCSKIVSVLRMSIDECNRLWLLDSGKINIFELNSEHVCNPKVVVIDLATDEVVGKYELPDDFYSAKGSLMGNIAVESRQCHDSYAYLGDVNNFKMTVFSLEDESFRQWNHTVLQPHDEHKEFNVNGVKFFLNDGIMAMTFYPKKDKLFFNAFCSVSQESVSGDFLRNGDLNADGSESQITFYNGTRPSQVTTLAISNDGILFFNPVSENSVRCWDVETDYNDDNQVVVAQNDETHQFVTGIKWRDGRLWALSSRLQKFIDGSVASNETNYRILTKTHDELVAGTKCEKQKATRRPLGMTNYARRPQQTASSRISTGTTSSSRPRLQPAQRLPPPGLRFASPRLPSFRSLGPLPQFDFGPRFQRWF